MHLGCQTHGSTKKYFWKNLVFDILKKHWCSIMVKIRNFLDFFTFILWFRLNDFILNTYYRGCFQCLRILNIVRRPFPWSGLSTSQLQGWWGTEKDRKTNHWMSNLTLYISPPITKPFQAVVMSLQQMRNWGSEKNRYLFKAGEGWEQRLFWSQPAAKDWALPGKQESWLLGQLCHSLAVTLGL